MATDIATLFPDKEVTLIHSRQTVMPRFHPKLSEIVLAEFDKLGVKTVLGSRAKVPEGGFDMTGPTVVETQDGRTVEADFVVRPSPLLRASHTFAYGLPSDPLDWSNAPLRPHQVARPVRDPVQRLYQGQADSASRRKW